MTQRGLRTSTENVNPEDMDENSLLYIKMLYLTLSCVFNLLILCSPFYSSYCYKSFKCLACKYQQQQSKSYKLQLNKMLY
ncbi:hypothetical protein LDENG_00129960, partial [Lucifuga dentata]